MFFEDLNLKIIPCFFYLFIFYFPIVHLSIKEELNQESVKSWKSWLDLLVTICGDAPESVI